MQGKPWTGDGPRILTAYFLHFIYSYWASTGGTLKSLGFYPAHGVLEETGGEMSCLKRGFINQR